MAPRGWISSISISNLNRLINLEIGSTPRRTNQVAASSQCSKIENGEKMFQNDGAKGLDLAGIDI